MDAVFARRRDYLASVVLAGAGPGAGAAAGFFPLALGLSQPTTLPKRHTPKTTNNMLDLTFIMSPLLARNHTEHALQARAKSPILKWLETARK